MNNVELDRLLCEKLGIEGTAEHDADCDLETYDWGNPWRTGSPKCTCTPKVTYPALSTTGDGMLHLMKELVVCGMEFSLVGDKSSCLAKVASRGELDYAEEEEHEEPSIALAFAAARAMKVKVPE